MGNLSSSIEEVLHVDELLELFEVSPDDSANISDGEFNYYFYSFSNLDEEKRNFLKEIGFQIFTDDILYIKGNEIDVSEKLPHLLPIFQKRESDLWDEIVERIVNINEKSKRGNIFKPTSRQLKLVIVWKGRVASTDDEFRSLISDLFLIFRESCKNGTDFRISRSSQSHGFWTTIGDLRNCYYSHDREHWEEKEREEANKKVEKAFEYLFGTYQFSKTPVKFIRAQFRLLEECLDFLDNVAGGLA